MGKDKFENEELLKWGWPEDVWFHVDNHSSAHVYVRMKKGETYKDLTTEKHAHLMAEMCQLTKFNSIQGKKEKTVKIVYTPFGNLKKKGDMDVGQVGFKKRKKVKNSAPHLTFPLETPSRKSREKQRNPKTYLENQGLKRARGVRFEE